MPTKATKPLRKRRGYLRFDLNVPPGQQRLLLELPAVRDHIVLVRRIVTVQAILALMSNRVSLNSAARAFSRSASWACVMVQRYKAGGRRRSGAEAFAWPSAARDSPPRVAADNLAASTNSGQMSTRTKSPRPARKPAATVPQPARAWPVSALPAAWRAKGEADARREGYRDLEAKLNAPPAPPWQPAIPLSELRPDCIAAAAKLQKALAPSLARNDDMSLSEAEFEERGVDDYARIFGHRISPRYFRELYRRTRDRDAGAEEWQRIEIFLPDRLALKKATAARDVAPQQAEEFASLASYLASLGNPQQPTETEGRGIWTLAFAHYDQLVGRGATRKQAARQVRAFLAARAPFLAASRDALLKAFDRKLARWLESGRDAKALRDGRAGNGDHFEFPAADRDLLIARAVFKYRGDIAPAWRGCLLRGEFSAPVLQRYRGQAADKSHVPTRIRDDVAPEVDVLTVMHQGPRAFDAIKGHVTRSYDGISALQCMQADDFTLNSYFYKPDGNGWFDLTRGQVLLFIDFRTRRVLGWSLEPEKSYSSLTIRSLCTHVFGEFGVPPVLYFERGIWKSATLLKGKTDPFSFTEISQGLREFGIKFLHAICNPAFVLPPVSC